MKSNNLNKNFELKNKDINILDDSMNINSSNDEFNEFLINIEFISQNLNKVFTINNSIIRLLTEEAESFNKISLDQMVNSRNSLIKNTVELIELKNIKLSLINENINVDHIKNILEHINNQELQINNLFEKNLDNLKMNINSINKLNKLKIYKQN